MSHYSIGDVQGCFAELTALLKQIDFDPERDTLWFTGDLVNRGPESLEVLRFIKSLKRTVVVLGNHDLHLLALIAGKTKAKKLDTLDAILTAPDRGELFHWLRQQPLLHHDANLGYTLVHAGLPPQWNLAKAMQCAREVEIALRSDDFVGFFGNMYGDFPDCWDDNLVGWDRLRLITNYLTRIRFCTIDGVIDLKTKGEASLPPKNYMPWFKVPNRVNKDLKIIFGHWAALNGETHEHNAYSLDTGCVWGNCLTAMRLEDGERFSVPCPQYNRIDS